MKALLSSAVHLMGRDTSKPREEASSVQLLAGLPSTGTACASEGKQIQWKGLSINGAWDFQAERGRDWGSPSKGRTGQSLLYAAKGNHCLQIQPGAKTKLVKSGQALWPLLCLALSLLGPEELPSTQIRDRWMQHSEQRWGCKAQVGKSRRENVCKED